MSNEISLALEDKVKSFGRESADVFARVVAWRCELAQVRSTAIVYAPFFPGNSRSFFAHWCQYVPPMVPLPRDGLELCSYRGFD